MFSTRIHYVHMLVSKVHLQRSLRQGVGIDALRVCVCVCVCVCRRYVES